MTKLLLLLTILLHSTFPSNSDVLIQSNRHEFVRKGNHANELAVGDYIVTTSFKEKSQAEASATDFMKSGLSNVKFGFLTLKNQWYVVVGPYQSLDKCREDMTALAKKESTKDCWLLTVHK